MRKKRQQRSIQRNLYLPVWLKLRMNNELKDQVDWMINWAEKCNADMVSQSVLLNKRSWKVTLQVKRVYDNKH